MRPSFFFLCASFPLAACGGIAPTGVTGPTPANDAGTPVGDDATPPPSGPWLDAASPTPPVGKDAGTFDSGSTGVPCTTDTDCKQGEECAWTVGPNWCTAFNPDGVCVKLVDLGCGVETSASGCTCAGTTVMWSSGCSGLPTGYAPEPLAHGGACGTPTPVVDAGGPPEPDASASEGCLSSADCAPGQECGYLVGDCDGPAQCLPTLDFGLMCNSVEIACSCNGTTTGLGCDAKASSTPVSYLGECGTGDGGS